MPDDARGQEARGWRAVVLTTALMTWTVGAVAAAVLVDAEARDVSGLLGSGTGLLLIVLVALAGMLGLTVAAALVGLRLRCGPAPVTVPLLLAGPAAALPFLLTTHLALS